MQFGVCEFHTEANGYSQKTTGKKQGLHIILFSNTALFQHLQCPEILFVGKQEENVVAEHISLLRQVLRNCKVSTR